MSWPVPTLERLILFTKRINGKLVGYWRNIEADDLGTGSSGGGTKFLADDLTWKVPSGTGGGSSPDVDIDCGTFLAPSDNTNIDCGSF